MTPDVTPDRWQELKKVFFAALERPSAERNAFLEQACGADPALRDEAERLLAAETRQPSILDASPQQLARFVEECEPVSKSRVGDTVGPYRIVRTLGEGGMGTVYLAERGDVDQRVALKVVRGARTAPDAVQRFLAERRILAQLEHPHVARLLDAGVTEDGAPFFTMEYVPGGMALTTYCHEHQLGIEARLALFAEACEAVWYAHQCLIIHRDLKPSNILVTEDESGCAMVKLVDFGIAKRLVGDLAAPGLTRTGLLAMTPSYAAPEQIRGEVVTTATDIYALGMILYELLAGRRPYGVEGLRPAEIERRICETEPARPSSARRNVAPPPASIHAPNRWGPVEPGRLQGDLDSICLRALEKDPHQRYASVDALRLDLRRHLAGLPVEARPRTAAYRVGKFVLRHRLGVATAALVGLTLVLLVTFYTWKLSTERNLVVASLAESEAVTDFLIELFEANDPDATEGESVTASTLLARGLERADALAAQPNVQARMLDAIGRIQSKLGAFEAAYPPLERAFALRREHLGWNDPATAESAHNLGKLLRHLARYDEAEALHRDALSQLPDLNDGMSAHVAALHNELGSLLADRGEYAEAEGFFRQALAVNQALLGRDSSQVATNLNALAFALHQQGQFAEAETLYREALSTSRHHHGAVHAKVALVMNNLGVLLLDRGARDQSRADLEAAEAMLEGTLSIRRQLLGAEHPSLAATLNNLGTLLHRLDRTVEAVVTHRQALAMRRRLLGEEHPLVALSLHNLGYTLGLLGQYDEAATHLQAALSLKRSFYGDDHPSTANTKLKLAELARETGDFDQAEALFQEAHAVFQSAVPANEYRLRQVREGLARLDAARRSATVSDR